MKPRPFLILLVCAIVAVLTGCNRVQYPLNLNTAPAEDLAELPGIGPKLAEAIVAGRPYEKVEDVERVNGIGPKKLAAIRDKVTVGERPAK